MGAIPKHKNGQAPKKRKPSSPPHPNAVVVTGPDRTAGTPTPSMQHDVNYVAGLGGVEESLDWIAKGIAKLSSDNTDFSLSTAFNASPVKITLAENDRDDTLARLVGAFERIADSLAKLAGLSRPRLEQWREQDEYDPRYRDSACDGGAPGPKVKTQGPVVNDAEQTHD